MKSSSDVVGALMKELRLQSGQPDSNFRLAVAVDGVNALWGRSTIKKEDRSYVRRHLKQPVSPSFTPTADTEGLTRFSVFLPVRWIQRS